MKHFKTYIYLIGVTILLFLSSCQKDFLQEENRSALTAKELFTEPKSFDQLVANVYKVMRPAVGAYNLGPENINFQDIDFQGTDIFTRETAITGTSELNDYVNLSPVNGAISVNWQNYYKVVSAANVAIDRSEEVSGLSEDAKKTGLGEAQFMRAYAYFHLVEQFGGVPLVLSEIRSPATDFSRASEEDVYGLIIQDLDNALAGVKENPEQYGRISKDAVKQLKALVLMTRGYKDFSRVTDFEDAAALAEEVITNHPLVPDFKSLFSISNQRNPEVIWSLLYGSNTTSQGIGNDRHKFFKFPYDIYPGMTRSTLLHNGIGTSPTPFFYTLFDDNDEREDATIRRVFYADEDVLNDQEKIVIAKSDTAIFFPKKAWTDAEKQQVPYTVINPGEYYINDGITQVHYPMFKKFDDPGVPYTTGGEAFRGQRDAFIFRSGGAHLIAAESYLMAGDPDKAAQHLNTLRTRAGITETLGAGDVTLSLILNERAKELAGETSRWMSLKRTGTLIDRVLIHNPHAALNKAISQKNLLRPIPQTDVQVTDGEIEQNPGY